MPLNKEPRKQKKKRQPSFTLPKNPYRHHYGTNPQPTKTKGPMVGTWTLLRSSTKQGQGRQDHQGLTRANKGFVTLNDKVSQNLDVQEIGSWMRKQKVFVWGLMSSKERYSWVYHMVYHRVLCIP